MKAVFRRELHALMHSVTGWFVLSIVPAVFAVMTVLHLQAGSAADYIRVIVDSTTAFVLIMPVCAAQCFSADRRTGADTLLHSLPLSAAGVVLGRFLAWCVPFCAGVLVSCLFPAALGFFAQIAALQTAVGMLLYVLCGMTVIAGALYISRLSDMGWLNALAALAVMALSYFCTDIVNAFSAIGAVGWLPAVLIALLALFFGWKASRRWTTALVCAILAEAAVMLVMGGDYASAMAFWNGFCSFFGIQGHFASLYIGVLDLGDLLFFPLAALLLLSLSAQGWRMECFERGRKTR